MVDSKPTIAFKSFPYLLMETEAGPRYVSLEGYTCWTIGRSQDNNFVLKDRWISRAHAMLQHMETGEYYLIDLGSRNGTFVNGRRVSIPVTLNNGDRLTFGQTDLEFYWPAQVNVQETDESECDDSATALLSVRRLISVMVVDIRDFTVLTRKLDEAILSETIGSWFHQAGQIIRDSGSWVDKYIGDAVMAVWFHADEQVSPHEVLQICQALSSLHKMTEELSNTFPLPFPLRIGAGVNTGYAMVGNTGSGDRPDYTALGDTVNAAFRLESSTKQLGKEVALAQATYHYIRAAAPDVALLEAHEVNLKGYDRPMLAYAGNFEDIDAFVRDRSESDFKS
jgi:adenylate cyclase